MPGDEAGMDDTTTLHGLGTPTGVPEPADEAAEAEREANAVIEALLPGTALLVVQQGPSAGARFLLDADTTTVGRNPDNEIFLDDITVSRHHARFVRTEAGFAVEDVGSLNGTYVNRSAVERVALAGGDEVQIGKFRMVFHDAAPQRAGEGA
jgi:pSer/pThr/pTyr-binding forkhead associated (FHA) protein